MELEEGASLHRLHGLLVPLRVPAVRVPAREDEAEELPLRTIPRGVPLPPQVREDLCAHPLDLLHGQGRGGQAIRRHAEHLPRRAAGRPPPEHEEVLRDGELERGPMALPGLGDLPGAPRLPAAHEQAGEGLPAPLLAAPLPPAPAGPAPVGTEATAPPGRAEY